MDTQELRRQYPELRTESLVHVDILDDGEKLEKIKDNSQDFVICNHFLEHCENPILAFKNFLRVLKPSGILYLALPDKRYTFDSSRPITSIAHLVRDHEEGPQNSRREHYEEWARLVEGIQDPDAVSRKTDDLMKSQYSIHFHVWSQMEMLEFVRYLHTLFDFELLLSAKIDPECILVIQKGKQA
jgi:predicted SAM-dependent methyltransferase